MWFWQERSRWSEVNGGRGEERRCILLDAQGRKEERVSYDCLTLSLPLSLSSPQRTSQLEWEGGGKRVVE